ncbi:ribonuclease H [Phenylobacterium sp.]|uniref:ribonuclease H n=1 Tax=Phenylobacterium sp. TaxID=1871053 RepID=UPI00301BF910
MAATRLWIAAAHDPAHRNGGWAFVRAGAGGETLGRAGGDRRTTRARMALAGLLAALEDLPPGEALAVVAPRPDALVLHTLLKPPAEPPAADADLRAALAKALGATTPATRTWTLAVGDPAGPTPAAFAAAWADLASDKAKAGGAFVHSIPRPNLAKVQGL